MKQQSLLLLIFFIFSSIININLASAAIEPIEFIAEQASNFAGFWEGKIDLYSTVILWAVFILLIILIYSALAFVDFPENAFTKWAIAIAISLIISSLTSDEQIITTIKSYAAVGVTAILFLPIIILIFFTFMVSIKGSTIGKILQKWLWLAYAIFLFVRAGGLLLAQLAEKSYKVANNDFALYIIEKLGVEATEINPTILITLIIAAIAIFFIFVRKNKIITEWFVEQKERAEQQKRRDIAARAKAVEEARAGET